MHRPVAAVALLALLPAAAGCSSPGSAADASSELMGVQPGPDVDVPDAGPDVEAPLSTTVRLANMSPDLGSIDFCWRPTGASIFNGPVLGALPDAGTPGAVDAAAEDGAASDAGAPADAAGTDAATAESDGAPAIEGGADAPYDASAEAGGDGAIEGSTDGGPALDATLDAADAAEDAPGEDAGTSFDLDGAAPIDVGFGAMSQPIALPAIGTLDIAVVQADQLSCAHPMFVGRVTLDAGKAATLVALGLASAEAGAASALSMVALVDELPDPATARVRFVHAALGWPGGAAAPPLSVQAGGVVLAPVVDPDQVTAPSTSPPVDTLGYATVQPIAGAASIEIDTIADAARYTWATAPTALTVAAGTTHTGFVVSLPAGGLAVAWCGAVASGGVVSPCTLLPAP